MYGTKEKHNVTLDILFHLVLSSILTNRMCSLVRSKLMLCVNKIFQAIKC